MVVISPYIPIITLNGLNGLNLPNERHKVDDWEKKSQVSTICCLQEIHFSSINKNKLKLQGWKLILQKAKQNEYSYTGSQETPGVTGKFGLGMRNEAGQRLTEFCQENALVIANTLFQQRKRRLYTWTSPDGQHRNQIDYIFCSQRWRSSIQATKIRPGADWLRS